MKQCEIKELYDLSQTIAGDYLSRFTYPWEALDGIKAYIRELGPTLDPEVAPFRMFLRYSAGRGHLGVKGCHGSSHCISERTADYR